MKSNQDWLELAYAVHLLEQLSESANGYIDDGSWLESLTTDIKNAKQLIRKHYKLANKEVLA